MYPSLVYPVVIMYPVLVYPVGIMYPALVYPVVMYPALVYPIEKTGRAAAAACKPSVDALRVNTEC